MALSEEGKYQYWLTYAQKDKLPRNLTQEQSTLFDTLSQFYLRSRYPDYTTSLSSFATKEKALSVYQKSKEVFQWLLTMKPQTGLSETISQT